VVSFACSSSGGHGGGVSTGTGDGGTGGAATTGGSGGRSTGGAPGTGGAGTGGTSSTGGAVGAGGAPDATAGAGGAADADAGQTSDGAGSPAASAITGTYGNVAIKPIMSAFWLGKPANLMEAAGGPFVVLLSAPVTCADLSKTRGWIATIPPGTQVMELIIGTTEVGKELTEKDGAGAGKFEGNYMFGASKLMEYKGASGTLTLTAYTPGKAVEGMVSIKFATGSAMGTFHAEWCPDGLEVGAP